MLIRMALGMSAREFLPRIANWCLRVGAMLGVMSLSMIRPSSLI